MCLELWLHTELIQFIAPERSTIEEILASGFQAIMDQAYKVLSTLNRYTFLATLPYSELQSHVDETRNVCSRSLWKFFPVSHENSIV